MEGIRKIRNNNATRDADGFERVCHVDDVEVDGRACIRLSTGRGVILFHVRDRISGDVWYSLDHACYHHGGPLAPGDIEEIGGRKCIVCPWHHYKIALESGEGLYIGIDPLNKGPDGRPAQTLKSKGIKQRAHRVKVIDDYVYIQDSACYTNKDDSTGGFSGLLRSVASAVTGTGSSASEVIAAKQKVEYEVASDEYAMEPFRNTLKTDAKIHSSR